MRGRFIVIEGMDGTGKTEQAERLTRRMNASGRRTVRVREPGGTEAGEQVRTLVKGGLVRSAVAELLLFNASRAELVETVIEPALSAGTNVVSDRYSGSTIAYQGYGRGLGRVVAEAANAIGTRGLHADVTILLRASDETASLRRVGREREPDVFEQASEDFRRRVERGYVESATREGWLTINAEGPKRSVEKQIWETVSRALLWTGEPGYDQPQGGEP